MKAFDERYMYKAPTGPSVLCTKKEIREVDSLYYYYMGAQAQVEQAWNPESAGPDFVDQIYHQLG
jgi:hypothetical protein